MWEGGFQLPEYPRSGSKAMIVEREKERERRAKVSVNNGQYIHLNKTAYWVPPKWVKSSKRKERRKKKILIFLLVMSKYEGP